MGKISRLPKNKSSDTDRLPEMWNHPTTAIPPLPALLEACRPTEDRRAIAPTQALPVSRRDLREAMGQLSRDLSDKLHEVRAPLYPEAAPTPVRVPPPATRTQPAQPPPIPPPPLHTLPTVPPAVRPAPVRPAPAPVRKKRSAEHSHSELLIYELRQTRWVLLLLLISVIIACLVGVGLLLMSFLPTS